MTILGPILAFISALLAIRKAKTWREELPGFKKLSPFGWVALSLALTALVINVYNTLAARAELNRARLTRQEIQKVAGHEIVEHLITLQKTLQVVNRQRLTQDPVDSATLRHGAWLPYDLMRGDQAAEELAQISFLPRIKIQKNPWGYGPAYADEIISEKAIEARAGLDRVVAKYSAFLDEGDLIALGMLSNNQLLEEMSSLRARVRDADAYFESDVPVQLVDDHFPEMYTKFVDQLWALHCRVVTTMENELARTHLRCDSQS